MPRVVLISVTLKVVVPLTATLASWMAGGMWQGNTLKLKVSLLEITLHATLSQSGGEELWQNRVSGTAPVASFARKGRTSQEVISGAKSTV